MRMNNDHPAELPAEEHGSIKAIAHKLTHAGLCRVPLQDLEDAAMRCALEENNGNRTYAARQLGISVRTLQRKLKGRSIV